MALNVVILAAGMGTRLGRPYPKPLTPLADGRSILRQQLDHLLATFGEDVHIAVVVGFKKARLLIRPVERIGATIKRLASG